MLAGTPPVDAAEYAKLLLLEPALVALDDKPPAVDWEGTAAAEEDTVLVVTLLTLRNVELVVAL